ncbi:MAG: ROK family protein [Candidatus Latescibacteria bacterium]|nr:ROK family protein [Candidatus Latescibacterota bacterium]
MEVLGVDIGGTGIKGAPVNVETGELTGERERIPTPHPATPDGVIAAVAQLVEHFNWKGPIGCGFPAVIKGGEVHTASNIAQEWIGVNAQGLLEQATGQTATIINDADAAGLAEMRFGAGKSRHGLVLIVTLGTGIGSALFIDGRLIPNTELGHIEVRGKDAERRAAESVRERKQLNWKQWARRVDEYLHTMERLLWPDLIIIGGGVSRKYERFFPHLTVRAEIVPAQLRNDAGIVGAALAAVPSRSSRARRDSK